MEKYRNYIIAASAVCGLSVVAIAAIFGNHGHKKAEIHTPLEIVVSFSADPSVKNDGPVQLGYPSHIFSISCADNMGKTCELMVTDGNKKMTKTFPYVEQEWFTPDKKNRPYHTLDTIMSLPSYNGNSDLKMGTNPVKNQQLVQVLQQNGWIAN